MTKNEAAKLLANKTHAIYNDNNNYELLREILSLAFPNDKNTKNHDFESDYMDGDIVYGYFRHDNNIWANVGKYLKDLEPIKLSDIEEISEPKYTSNLESDFELIVDKTLNQIRETLIEKGKEYRRNNNPYHNFEIGARKKNISREKVLDGMLLKHEISIEDMTNDIDLGKLPNEDTVNEKFGDNIIYLILKKAMFIDRIVKSKTI